MKKHFVKPALVRCAIKLNENIALSWKYYFGTQTALFHFSHLVHEVVLQNAGCYDLFVENPNWTTGDEPGQAYYDWFIQQGFYHEINSGNAMIAWMTAMDYSEPSYGCQSPLGTTTVTPTPTT